MAVGVVAAGTWLYDNVRESPVWVVRADFDFWYELAATEDALEPGEQPNLNEDGLQYYVTFRPLEGDKFWPDNGGFASVKDAQRAAERRVPSAVDWRAP